MSAHAATRSRQLLTVTVSRVPATASHRGDHGRCPSASRHVGKNGDVPSTPTDPTTRPGLSAADRERLARRYPKPRVPRLVLIGIVAVVAAASIGWLIWAGLVHANPTVSAKVPAYTVVSDTRIDVTVTVDRPDPSIAVVCRVSAQAPDFQPVGEVNLPVEASTARVVDVKVSITTVRRATTAVVRECSPT